MPRASLSLPRPTSGIGAGIDHTPGARSTMSRCHLLSALAICVAVHSARADCNFPSAVKTAAVFPNRAIDLSTGSTTRLPYAKDFRLQVQPAAKLSALTVFYSLDKSTAGPRSGLVAGVTNDGCVWSAPMPRLHVNET